MRRAVALSQVEDLTGEVGVLTRVGDVARAAKAWAKDNLRPDHRLIVFILVPLKSETSARTFRNGCDLCSFPVYVPIGTTAMSTTK